MNPNGWIGNNNFMLFFGTKCLRCGKKEINKLKPSLWRKAEAAMLLNMGGKPKTLNVCKDCGFSWEDR